MKYTYYKYYNILSILIFIFICIVVITSTPKITIEQFDPNSMATTWSPDLILRFEKFQNTENTKQYQFNYQQLQQQASAQEAEELLATGKWTWSDNIKNEYLNRLTHHSIIKIPPLIALNAAQKIYNAQAISQILGWNVKEGEFLLYGAKTKYNKNIKCKGNGLNTPIIVSSSSDKSINDTPINPEDLPSELPGFSFIHNPCNPCLAIDNDFSCPFELNVKNKRVGVSKIWKQLWNV